MAPQENLLSFGNGDSDWHDGQRGVVGETIPNLIPNDLNSKSALADNVHICLWHSFDAISRSAQYNLRWSTATIQWENEATKLRVQNIQM